MICELVSCPVCGKRMVARPDKAWCGQCLGRHEDNLDLVAAALGDRDVQTAAQVASATGLPLNEVEGLIDELTGVNGISQQRRLCTKCRKDLAQPGAKYCLRCRLELYRLINDATDDLLFELSQAEAREQIAGVVQTLRDKRGRASSGRLNPAPLKRHER